MKQFTLAVMLMLPITVIAQQKSPAVEENQGNAGGFGLKALTDGLAAQDAPRKPMLFLDARLLLPLLPARPQQTTTPNQAGGQQFQRPRPEGSMVGYIDNAVIQSQLRIRFDYGRHGEFPDRAEFFYAKCGCYQGLRGTGLPAYDPDAPGPQPGVLTDFNFEQLYVNGEYAPSRRVSFFAELPVRWLQPKAFVPGFGSFPNQSGLSDIRAGLKVGLLPSETNNNLTFQFRIDTPSGDESKGLGTGHTSIEPSVLYYQPLGARGAIESEFSFWHPVKSSRGVPTTAGGSAEDFAGNVLFYGVGPSYLLYSGSHVSFGPVVELAGWHVLSGFQTVWISGTHIADEAKGTDIVNLKVGVRTAVGPHNSLYVGYGHALTDAVWYKEIIRAEYRYIF